MTQNVDAPALSAAPRSSRPPAELAAVVLDALRVEPSRWPAGTAELVRVALADLGAMPLGRCLVEMALARAQHDETLEAAHRAHAALLLDVLLGDLDARRAPRVRRLRARIGCELEAVGGDGSRPFARSRAIEANP